MKTTNETDLEVLGLIADRLIEGRSTPTYRELAESLGVSSTNAVAYRIGRLLELGFVEREERRARGVSLTATGWNIIGRAV